MKIIFFIDFFNPSQAIQILLHYAPSEIEVTRKFFFFQIEDIVYFFQLSILHQKFALLRYIITVGLRGKQNIFKFCGFMVSWASCP